MIEEVSKAMNSDELIIEDIKKYMQHKPSEELRNRILNNASFEPLDNLTYKIRKRMSRLMIAAIVVSVALLLGGVALAVTPLITGSIYWEKNDGGTVFSVASTAYPHRFGENFREFVDNQQWESFDEGNPDSYSGLVSAEYPTFSTLEEIEYFFNIVLPKNKILDMHEIEGIYINSLMYHPVFDNARVFLQYSLSIIPENSLDCNSSSYRKPNTAIRLFFEINDNRELFHQTIQYLGNAEIVENYVSPTNGIEAVLHTSGLSSGFITSYNAIFSVNDIIFWIGIVEGYGNSIDKDVGFGTLKAIIDAFK